MSSHDAASPPPSIPPNAPGPEPFRLGGRMGLKVYWLAMLGLVLLLFLIVGAVASMNAPTGSSGAFFAGFLGFVFVAYLGWMMIVRLHDLDRSGWWFVLLGPIPVVALIGINAMEREVIALYGQKTAALIVLWVEVAAFALLLGGLLILGCMRGSVGPNRYGPDPRAAAPKPPAR